MWLRCFRLSSPPLLCLLQYCSQAVVCSLLYAGCSALHRCVRVLELISHSSHKGRAETLLCLAEHASLVPRCTAWSEYVQCDVMRDNRQGLENCVTVSDLVLPHFCPCVCVHVCPCNLSAYVFIPPSCFCVSTFTCLLCIFVVSLCHLLVLCVIVSRPDSAEGFSSCPSTGSRNGEKDWENDSTTSSTPSNAEYTGIRHTYTVDSSLTAAALNLTLHFYDLMAVLSHRTQTVQGAECQVQQAHHPERPGSLLPGRQSQRRTEKQDT